ncbi:hypothetical protein C5O78_09510 [Treponema phagedenis]|nr:hypothetical protein C5O78_09510 [Treponema phagedenis]
MEPLPSVAVLSFAVHGKTKPASLKASILQNSVDAFKHRFCMEPLPSVAVLSFAVHGKTKPASLKASILQNSVDAFKHRFCLEPPPSVAVLSSTRRNGETTAIRGSSEFCRPWQNQTCEFKSFNFTKQC